MTSFGSGNGDAAQEYAFYQIIDKLEREPAEQSDEKLRRAGLLPGRGIRLHRGRANPRLS